MTSIDDKIKQALSNEYQELISEKDKIDANIFKQMAAGFKSKMGWIYISGTILGVLITAMSIYSIYSFYHETEVKSLIGWGVAIIITVLLTQIMKLWIWSEMSSNRVIREVKILELQLAQVLKNQEKG
ncbi:MAG: hypothetical protein L3J83_07140 [Proteobacteria bacterium]|nr:hypothetical protein [Pseudomonadota bacterium]